MIVNSKPILSNIESLFIRACKSDNSEACIRRVYRRFYYNGRDKDEHIHICMILIGICEKYSPFKAVELVDALNPNNIIFGMTENKIPYYHRVLQVAISKLRLTGVGNLPGYRPHIQFRK